MPIFTSPPLPEPAREGERRNRKEGAQKSLSKNVKKNQKASKSISDTQQRESFSLTVAHILPLPQIQTWKKQQTFIFLSLSLSRVKK